MTRLQLTFLIRVLNFFQGPAKVQLAKPNEFLAKHSKEKIITEGMEKCIN